MPRWPTTHVREPNEWFSCVVPYCPSKFRSINGRTQHIRAMHTCNELLVQCDNIRLDFPAMPVSECSRVPSPQSETMDELYSQALNDFELTSTSSPRVSDLPELDNIQPQLEDYEFRSPSPPPFIHANSGSPAPLEESMQTEDHPFINGKYAYFFHSAVRLIKYR